MFGKRALDVQPRSRVDLVMRLKLLRELNGTRRTGSGNVKSAGGRGRHAQRRPRRGGADAAEPPAERAAEIQDAEVEPRGRLDEDLAGHSPATARGAERTKSARIDIASISYGPAVLSTMTCRRVISLSIRSRGRMCSRVT